MHVMFYVQHLLGIGHIRRAIILTQALLDHGLQVTVLFGGRKVPELDFGEADFVQLPAVHVTDHKFTLLDDNELPVDDRWLNHRKDKLLSVYHSIKPDVLLFEMYPFGRRKFRFELEPLMAAAKQSTPRPLIISSVRDMLVEQSKPERNPEILAKVREHFDLVLVHGDETLIKLEDTLPGAECISDLTRYTGYITEPENSPSSTVGTGEVIVSVGGGATGAPLLYTALEARGKSPLADNTWRLLTGPNLPDSDFQELQKRAPENVIIERFRHDLQELMGNCVLSISQGGYNSIMNVLRSNAKAISVPYDDGGETEQIQRALMLQEKNILKVVFHQTLSADSLNKAIREFINSKFESIGSINLSGAETSAKIIGEFVASNINRENN